MLGIGNGIDMSSLVPPYSSYSVNFDESNPGDYISCGTGHAVIGTGDFTMASWVKAPELMGAPQEFILSKFEGVSDWWYFGLQWDGSIIFSSKIGGTSHHQRCVGSVLDSDDADTWIHVAISYDRDASAKIFFNGDEVTNGGSSTIDTSDLGDVTADLKIGQYGATTENVTINDVAVWNAALTPAQITKIYNNGNPLDHIGTQGVGASNLIHWWRMGDGPGDEGTTIADQVGSAHGTLTNGASIVKDAPNNP